jgi:4-hydroxy-tetrahydrodipicolinate synthase
MVHQALEGDFASARQTVYKIDELITYLFEQGNPAGVKAAMKHLGVCDDHVRLPLMPINADLRNKIGAKLATIGLR